MAFIAGVTKPITPDVLANAPELAALAVLENLLSVATQALVAEHSSLREQPWPHELHGEPVSLREARRILRRITPLEAALVRYRIAVLDALPLPVGDDASDLPF